MDSRDLDGALLESVEAARKLKPPYRASGFRRMVNELGGKETVDRLLAKKEPSDGFVQLFMRGPENLKLSFEYIILQHPWRSLFTTEQLAVARQRLQEHECDVPSDDRMSDAAQ